MDNTSTVTRLVPHDTLYFGDGDVALSLEDRDDEGPMVRIYRVDQLILARHSPVFQGLFSLPQHPGVNEKYDGVPMVPLVGDDPVALEAVLRFMYNPGSLVFEDHDSDTALLAAKVLKVAEKYAVDGLRPIIVRQLERDWPTTLDAWNRRQSAFTGASEMASYAPNTFAEPRRLEPVAAIRIGLDYKIPSILPIAFYDLAQIPLYCDYDRVYNGKWPYLDRDFGQEYDNLAEITLARWSLLDSDSFMRLGLGREDMCSHDRIICKAFKIPGCGEAECGSERARLQEHYRVKNTAFTDMPDPLGQTASMLRLLDTHDLICEQCESTIRKRLDRCLACVWADIPRMFSLDKLDLK